MKIGFLYNHDQGHQVAHSLPIALAMAQAYPDVEVAIATTNAALDAIIERWMPSGAGTRVKRVHLHLKTVSRRFLSPVLNPLLPFNRAAIYGDNLDFFRSLDGLIVTETTSLLIKSHYGLHKPFMIWVPHGAGDRAIGFKGLNAKFDHIFVAGPLIHDRMVHDAGVPAERISIVGYPKFDLLPKTRPRLPMQTNGRPTVLYNPHPAPHLSSWYTMGREVLEYFRNSSDYNLIFAPHVMLFQRRWTWTIDPIRARFVGHIPEAIRRCPHIHVDLGSVASIDMTYTQAADIYLGDASSQVYEFLFRPRPCVFLDAHHTNWQGRPDYVHWRNGDVVASVAELDHALRDRVAQHAQYRPIQQRLFAQHFSLTNLAAGLRAARRAVELVELCSRKPMQRK